MKIPLCKANVGIEEKTLIQEVVNSGIYVGGEKTRKFEDEFAKYLGTKYAISMNSCTSALQAIIQGLGLKGKIAVPSFTFVASANSIVTAGCEPVFVDIDEKTFNMSPESLIEAIEEYPEITGVMVVHYAGQSANMEELKKICDEKNLYLIEDSAETCGGTFKENKTGSFTYGCFSFFPTKNMCTGEGGMLTFNDVSILEKMKQIRGHGISTDKKFPWDRKAAIAGYNFRMGEINAAMGIEQLKKLEEMNKKRREIANKYKEKLKNINEIEIPFEDKNCKHVYQMYVIKLSKKINRDKFVQKLNEMGIGASVHFNPPVHMQPFYKNFERVDLENTEKIIKKIVTLPIYPTMTSEEIDYICNCIKEIIL